MRTQLLGGLALLLGAAALLCGADVARAQVWMGNGTSGPSPYSYSQANGPWATRYGPAYGPNPQAAQWYAQYAQYLRANGFDPSYAYSYPYNASGGGGYNPYSQNPQAAQAPPAQPYPSAEDVAMPTVPVPAGDPGAEPGAGHEGAGKEPAAPAHRDRFWVEADYAMSFIKPWRLSTPLVTTGPPTSATSPPGYHPAGLGQPDTVVLFGDRADFDRFDGVRLGLGVYLDDACRFVLEWTGQYNFDDHVRFAASADATGSPLIGRPVFDTVRGAELAYLDSNPGLFTGGVNIDARSQFLTTELNLRALCCNTGCFYADALVGFRFMRLTESLTIRDSVTPLIDGSGLTFEGFGIPAGDVLTDVDSFRTTNHFYGLQLGAGAGYEGKWVFVNAFGKVAIGATDEQVAINGSTTLNDVAAGPQTAGGGILALATNSGLHNRTVIGFVPEAGLNVGVKVLPCLRLTAGYSFLVWNAVVRPGMQIDRAVNSTQVPSDNTFGTLAGPQRPAFSFHDEFYWMHTLTFGLDFHY
jgi:hypothetical protein